jgi:AAA15 family ATPase/GTPase
MTNTLVYDKLYRSITQLNTINLPNFVVLVGRNGSGKSHLLSAIQGGQIRSSLISDLSSDVKLFDSNTIIPRDTGIFDPAQDQSRQSQLFNSLRLQRDQHLPTLQQVAIQYGVPAD